MLVAFFKIQKIFILIELIIHLSMSLGFESYLERASSRQVYKKFQVCDFIYYM